MEGEGQADGDQLTLGAAVGHWEMGTQGIVGVLLHGGCTPMKGERPISEDCIGEGKGVDWRKEDGPGVGCLGNHNGPLCGPQAADVPVDRPSDGLQGALEGWSGLHPGVVLPGQDTVHSAHETREVDEELQPLKLALSHLKQWVT
jgi:hypothetical protein